jgi:phasin family protein
MYPFPQTVAPAVKTHVDAQTAFLNDISKSWFRSIQQICDLNIQLVQTMIEESALASKQVLSAERQTEVLHAAASRAQPASDKLRAYQQHITRLAADTQVEIARVTEQHVQNTSRTARALADEVARDANEQTERGLRAQQETVRQFADPFTRTGNGAAGPSQRTPDGEGPQAAEKQPIQPGAQAAAPSQRGSTTH